ncbi:hypothetical protein EXIGLDRAFT_183689 [Exidia glandulosa HHB12029]|uniref:Uncharacterized protein n=1 Tax=Exidia glandulosa HHB12029 TaxID=1314781 RepID=A0A165F193_EXIGL|nr:hypothetical protein EXIGLDRAFT_183689 [Exidia glandulosa HHB12029]
MALYLSQLLSRTIAMFMQAIPFHLSLSSAFPSCITSPSHISRRRVHIQVSIVGRRSTYPRSIYCPIAALAVVTYLSRSLWVSALFHHARSHCFMWVPKGLYSNGRAVSARLGCRVNSQSPTSSIPASIS